MALENQRDGRPSPIFSWVIGFFGCCLAALAISYGLTEQRRHLDESYKATAEYAGYAAEQAYKPCKVVPRTQLVQCLSDAKAEYYKNANDKRREYADLLAQQKSALWTSIMGVAGVTGMIISIVGVWLVYATFRETRRTADEAANNVEAFKQAERARIAIVRQDYVHEDITPQWLANLVVKNFGRSPAYIRSIQWAVMDSNVWHNNFHDIASAQRNLDVVVDPGRDPTSIATINLVKGHGYATGIIEYDTQFEQRCKTYFLWRMGNTIDGDYGAQICYLDEAGMPAGWPTNS